VTVREASAQDAAAVADLLTQLGYPHSTGEAGSRLDAWAGGDRRLLLLAADGEAVVGFVAVAAVPYLERAGSWARIVALAVDAAHRRRGIGRELVEAAEGRPRAGGACRSRSRARGGERWPTRSIAASATRIGASARRSTDAS
jgi:ribosomal protein S18 acetylase RimI-like enzyme